MAKIKEGIDILKNMGLPRAQQNERSSLTLLALLDLRKNVPWSKSKKRIIRIHDILMFIQKAYGKKYAENTRETIRRQTLHQFEQAGIVVRNPDDPSRPTNSPNTVYTIADEALNAIKNYGMPTWKKTLQEFVKNKGRLIEKYEKRKTQNLIVLNMPTGNSIRFSPGKHNELQVEIIKSFAPRFCPTAKLVYVGDTARKLLFIKEKTLKSLGIPITEHDKLPDVVMSCCMMNKKIISY